MAGAVPPQDSHPESHKGSDYFPLSVGNKWQYVIEDHSDPSVKTVTWRVARKEILDGVTVYHLRSTPAQGDDTLDLCEVEGGIRESDSERFVLKDPLHTGDRWSDVVENPGAEEKSDAFEVVSAGNPCSVGGDTFDDCTTVREDNEAKNVASATTYARGIGPVKYVYFTALHSTAEDTVLTITSWEIH